MDGSGGSSASIDGAWRARDGAHATRTPRADRAVRLELRWSRRARHRSAAARDHGCPGATHGAEEPVRRARGTRAPHPRAERGSAWRARWPETRRAAPRRAAAAAHARASPELPCSRAPRSTRCAGALRAGRARLRRGHRRCSRRRRTARRTASPSPTPSPTPRTTRSRSPGANPTTTHRSRARGSTPAGSRAPTPPAATQRRGERSIAGRARRSRAPSPGGPQANGSSSSSSSVRRRCSRRRSLRRGNFRRSGRSGRPARATPPTAGRPAPRSGTRRASTTAPPRATGADAAGSDDRSNGDVSSRENCSTRRNVGGVDEPRVYTARCRGRSRRADPRADGVSKAALNIRAIEVAATQRGTPPDSRDIGGGEVSVAIEVEHLAAERERAEPPLRERRPAGEPDSAIASAGRSIGLDEAAVRFAQINRTTA